MTEPINLLILLLIFLLAGTVKGLVGFGLPTVSLAVLTLVFDLPTAMALFLVPSILTNLWQACVGKHFKSTLTRIWPFLLAATLTVWLGALVLTRVHLPLLTFLLGLLLLVYAVLNLLGKRFKVRRKQETRVALITGVANGILTGMTGSFLVPGVMYLQGINLKKDALIQAMGMLFFASTLALGVSLQQLHLLSTEEQLLSLAAVAPSLVGMVLGQKIRQGLPETTFRRVFFVSLLLLGGYLCATRLYAFV